MLSRVAVLRMPGGYAGLAFSSLLLGAFLFASSPVSIQSAVGSTDSPRYGNTQLALGSAPAANSQCPPAWNIVPSPAYANLLGVKVISQNDAWAVGQSMGLIEDAHAIIHHW